jgi:hypothetical protein
MILELIRKEIRNSKLSRNKICRAAKVEPAALCRFMKGGSLKAETVEALLRYFGFEIVPKKRRRKAR